MNKTLILITKLIKTFFSKLFSLGVLSPKSLNILMIILFLFVVVSHSSAIDNKNMSTHGHPWAEIGDGLITFSTPSSWHTYTLPDGTSTIMTTNGVSQGDIMYGSGDSIVSYLPKDVNSSRYLSNSGVDHNPFWSLINLSDGVSGILPSLNGGTGNGFTKFTGPSTSEKTFSLPDADATILTSNSPVTLTQGGTGAALIASSGGILYSGTSTMDIIAPTSTLGLMLRSGSSVLNTLPKWSEVTYPSVAGPVGSKIVSDGNNFIVQSNKIETTTTLPSGATGGITSKAMKSATHFMIGMFNIPQTIDVNSITTSNTKAPKAGTLEQCIYSESGNKLIDVTSPYPIANTELTTNLSSTVTLYPGNYYMAVGCANNCNVSVNYWTTLAGTPLTDQTPPGKKVREGRVNMSSGFCEDILPPIIEDFSSTPVGRLDS